MDEDMIVIKIFTDSLMSEDEITYNIIAWRDKE